MIALTKPILLPLLYSPAFLGAGRYLRWTLLGDYLKVASWILSIPMLARPARAVFLASDLAASGVFLISAILFSRWRSPLRALPLHIRPHACRLPGHLRLLCPVGGTFAPAGPGRGRVAGRIRRGGSGLNSRLESLIWLPFP